MEINKCDNGKPAIFQCVQKTYGFVEYLCVTFIPFLSTYVCFTGGRGGQRAAQSDSLPVLRNILPLLNKRYVHERMPSFPQKYENMQNCPFLKNADDFSRGKSRVAKSSFSPEKKPRMMDFRKICQTRGHAKSEVIF